MRSRPLWELDCVTKDALFALCLDEADLDRLGVPPAPACLCGSSAELQRRNLLHQASHARSALAARAGDLFDLRYADLVVAVRGAGLEELRESIAAYRRDPVSVGIGPLLWVLATDGRVQVQRLGRLLVEETRLASLQLLAYATRAPRSLPRPDDTCDQRTS